jgi:creatinine amidohydrolase
MTSDDAVTADVVLVPLGATEQHGPHLPLGTDTTIAERWAAEVATRLRAEGLSAVVAPALAYGSSGEHQCFPGTLSIGHDALRLVLVELIRSAAHTFERVVLLSGHAGNAAPARLVVDQMTAEGHDVCCLFPTWESTEARPIDAHAGRTETALMLHLDPVAVDTEQSVAGDTRPLAEILPVLMADGVAAVSPSGVLGDPTAASAAEGLALFDDLVDRTVAELLGH